MICGHCHYTDATIEHVRTCSREAWANNSSGTIGAAEREQRREPEHVQPTVRARVIHRVTEAGMYKLGDTIYKVQKAVHGSGHLYAKKLVVCTDGSVTFEYAPGALRSLCAEDRMSLEDAKAFGALYGTCCVCGRTLTDEGSIEAGIGPICAGRL